MGFSVELNNCYNFCIEADAYVSYKLKLNYISRFLTKESHSITE